MVKTSDTAIVSQVSVDEVVKDFKTEIANLSEQIKSSGIGGEVLNELKKTQKELQDSVSSFLLKKNIMTQKQYDDAYEQLRIARRKILETDFKKSGTWVKIAIGIAIAALIYKLVKKV